MKTLFLLRHAKSSWSDTNLADFDRPLNDRGQRTAPQMGNLMKSRGYLPDVVISSPAARARHTAELASEAAGIRERLQFEPRIYEASPSTLLDITNSIDDSVSAAMLVGHNPGMEGFVRLLTGAVERMPTAALAVIEVTVDSWKDVPSGRGQLIEVIRPKEVFGSSD